MSIPLLVLMVPVFFGLMGFALDLGRLYLIKGELNQAANAMALAAASQLIGTDASLDNATQAAQGPTLDNTNGFANKYNFGSIVIGQNSGNLTNTVNSPTYYDSMSAVGGATQAAGSTARFAQVTMQADAPLLFWSILPVGQTRKTAVGAIATAGISAPLCIACQILPFAVAAVDSSDTANWGFVPGTIYTFYSTCTGTPPAALAGAPALLPYLLINRFDLNSPLTDDAQLYIDGAGGLPFSTTANPTGSAVPIGCMGVNDFEQLWTSPVVSAAPTPCTTVLPSAGVVDALCGLFSRYQDSSQAAVACNNVTGFPDIATPFLPDPIPSTDETAPYTSYLGNGRGILTIPVVSALDSTGALTMQVLGFRQFLLEPVNSDTSTFTAADPNGRFAAMYIGNPAPVPQGYVDDRAGLSCDASAITGPGKVVLHQ